MRRYKEQRWDVSHESDHGGVSCYARPGEHQSGPTSGPGRSQRLGTLAATVTVNAAPIMMTWHRLPAAAATCEWVGHAQSTECGIYGQVTGPGTLAQYRLVTGRNRDDPSEYLTSIICLLRLPRSSKSADPDSESESEAPRLSGGWVAAVA